MKTNRNNHAAFHLGDKLADAQAHAEHVKKMALSLHAKIEKLKHHSADDEEEVDPYDEVLPDREPSDAEKEEEFHKEVMRHLLIRK